MDLGKDLGYVLAVQVELGVVRLDAEVEGAGLVEFEVDDKTAEANDVFGTPASLEPNGPCINPSSLAARGGGTAGRSRRFRAGCSGAVGSWCWL